MGKEYISRDEALNFEMEIEADPEEIQAVTKGMALYAEHIKSIPAAKVNVRKTGEWMNIRNGIIPSGQCSKCWTYNRITPFCPICGARMVSHENK